MDQSKGQKIYHGQITPGDFVRDLMAQFNRGNYRVQQFGGGPNMTVQIATRDHPSAGGPTSITINLQSVEDGVSVDVSKAAWLGVAASLGFTALSAARNPFALLGRINDLAQDIENLSLTDEVWKVIETTARTYGVGQELSDRLKRLVCEFCGTANPIGTPSCIACGAPMGVAQPKTCPSCGFVITSGDKVCPNCHRTI